MTILVLMASAVSAEEAMTGRISGKWISSGKEPMAGGLVYFFNGASGPRPSPDSYWRVPDEVANIDTEGRFSVELVAGNYYLGAIKRIKGNELGPPLDGDFFFFSRDERGGPR